MLCLEVSVNGTRHCLAAPADMGSFSAQVAHHALHGDRATATLTIEGTSPDHATKYVWGNTRPLTIGDVITIRLVKATAPDPPIASPSGMPAIEPFAAQVAISMLRDLMNGTTDTARSLRFSLLVVLIGFAMLLLAAQRLSPH